MELRHLRYFIAVAEEQHITRAAERLEIQQPPLSRQIKAMERELDVQLFRRKARGVELTEAGRTFLDDARAVLARLDHAFEATRRTARGERGRICVGITSSSTYHAFVPKVIRTYRELFPLVSLALEEQHNSGLIEGLRGERIDVAFVRTAPADASDLVVNLLLKEPMVIALPRAHPLARRNRHAAIPLKALANETFITVRPPHGSGLSRSTLAAYQAAGFNPRIGQEAPRLPSMLNLVAAGLGISFVPSSLRRMNLDGVVYRTLTGADQLTAPLSLISRRGDPSPVVRHFLSLVKTTARSHRD